MKIFVSGVSGQLGHDVMNELHKRGIDAVGSDIKETYSGIMDGTPVTSMPYLSLDITDREAVMREIGRLRPDAVVHCAAWTAVDAAEEEANQDLVRRINADGTRYIAQACSDCGSKMVYLSTDYVFDGTGTEPWKPDCKDYSPLNVYGQSKLEGELAVSETLKKYDTIRVVNDQIGTPTYTLDLARLLVDMIETEKYGYYHATNEGGFISWYDLACEVFRQAGYPTKVVPVTTQEYGLSKAARPFNSRLDKSKLAENGFTPLPDWKDAVRRYLEACLS